MARRRVGARGFADAIVEQARPVRDRLSEIDGLLEWSRFAVLLPEYPTTTRGKPAYPALVLFKALLLQRWYQLSDPGLEEALSDRLSFRRFCGLSLADETPDHSTLWRFRERLTQRDLMPVLMAELAAQLDGHGVVLRQGTLIDASLVRSAARRPTKSEGKTSPTDPDAKFGSNNTRRVYTFGYKMLLAVDAFSTLVRGVTVSPGNHQEIRYAKGLVQGDELAVYADRGYDSQDLRDHLAEHGIADGVMRRAHNKRPLTEQERERNQDLIPRRRPVEAVFGTLKRTYGLARMRCFGIARNATDITLACFAYNLRRLLVLTAR